MLKNKFLRKYLVLMLFFLLFVSIKQSVLAIEYKTQLSVPIPVDCDILPSSGQLDPGCEKKEIGGLVDIVTTMYRFAVGAGTFLAIIMIVIGGIQYTASEVVGSKEDAKKKIQNAIYGLILLAVSIPILKFINPQITLLSDSDIGDVGEIKSSYGTTSEPSLCGTSLACSPIGSVLIDKDYDVVRGCGSDCRFVELDGDAEDYYDGDIDGYKEKNRCGTPISQCTSLNTIINQSTTTFPDGEIVVQTDFCSLNCTIRHYFDRTSMKNKTE